VELGEGIRATCRIAAAAIATDEPKDEAQKLDMSSLSAMLNAKWKGEPVSSGAKPEPVRAGQIRSFRIVKLDAAGKKIELELA
jgi:small subunit ribosomal protein S1